MNKRKIQDLGKVFSYLKDPTFRVEELRNSTLVVENARFADVEFIGHIWSNVRFINCDFIGSHQISPESVSGSTFENCHFAGVFNLGVLTDVRFLNCRVDGKSYVLGDTGSTFVTFERCVFEGTSDEPNNWGSVGSYGEAMFIECRAKWFDLAGYAGLTLSSCQLTDVGCQPAGGKEGIYASVLIENSKLWGPFAMVAADLQSLTIRDTVLDNLDLTNATIKADVVIERVKGGSMQIGIKEGAGSFTLKDSQIYGNGDGICYVYAGAFKSVLVEKNIFGGDVTKPTVIGGGFDPDIKSAQPTLTQSFVLRGNKVPFLRSGYLNAGHVVIEGNAIDSLDLQQSRIDELEIASNTITRSVNLTGAQAKKSKVQPFAEGQAKLDGSNIKPN